MGRKHLLNVRAKEVNNNLRSAKNFSFHRHIIRGYIYGGSNSDCLERQREGRVAALATRQLTIMQIFND